MTGRYNGDESPWEATGESPIDSTDGDLLKTITRNPRAANRFGTIDGVVTLAPDATRLTLGAAPGLVFNRPANPTPL